VIFWHLPVVTTLCQFGPEKQQHIHLLNGHSNWVRSVAFSPNGKLLASCGEDQATRVWNVNSGHCIQVFLSSTWTGWLWSVSFSRNGRALAVGAGCGDVRVHSLLDYGALSRASLLLHIAVAPYVVLDVANFLDTTRFATNDSHMHGDKISFLVSLQAKL
jgi:WD40 repeat protein